MPSPNRHTNLPRGPSLLSLFDKYVYDNDIELEPFDFESWIESHEAGWSEEKKAAMQKYRAGETTLTEFYNSAGLD